MKNVIVKLIVATLLFCVGGQLVYAKQYSQTEALALCNANKLSMPVAEPDGRIQTLNEHGSMSPVFDTATIQFIQDSQNKKVLEIGGGYGKVMLEVLSKSNPT